MSIEKALEVVKEMFHDRQYIFYREKDNVFFYKTANLKFALITTINTTSCIKNFAEYIFNDEFESLFFIYTNNINCSHKVIEKNLKFKIEIWSVYELQVNVSKHYLQPMITKVEKIPKNLKESKIPKISFYDPIVRYYRFKHKTILNIQNKDGIIHYRVVV